MEKSKKFVITISRQLGSGGAYIGQRLAKKLDIFYADREIIDKLAKQYSVLEEDLASNDEKILSFWQSFWQFNNVAFDVYVPPTLHGPTDQELFEAEIIQHVANERSSVIIGRCGSYILKDYPNHVSIFLHADNATRNERTRKLYHVSEEEAERMMTLSDKERARYCKVVTSKEWEWNDSRRYDLCLDTSKLEVDKCVEFILDYLKLAGIKG
jgi:cytidylate kinase